MKPEEEEWYLGIELGSEWTQISCYGSQMQEPETKSTIAGAQSYRIPTAVCKKKGIGQWYFGEEAKKLENAGKGIYVNKLLEKALAGETVQAEEDYQAQELLLVFLRKVIRMAAPAGGVSAVTKCVYSVGKVSKEIMALLLQLSGRLGFLKEQILIQDCKESFYAYAVSQDRELWLYDVILFSDTEAGILQQTLSFDSKTQPRVSTVSEKYVGVLPEDVTKRDLAFTKMVQEAVSGSLISAVYLIGAGFEGGWMKESLQTVCRGRRAFQGKNLYTKGACYAGMQEAHQNEAETVYFCDYKNRYHMFLKMTRKGEEYLYVLAEAGKNLHQINKKCRILLEGEPVLDVWLQEPGKKEAVIESLELQGLTPAAHHGCRLDIFVYADAGGRVMLQVQDIGMGELCPGNGQSWEYEIGE